MTKHENAVRVLFIGDIVGKPGRNAVSMYLPGLFSDHGVDFCIANVENAAGGFGVTAEIAEQLHSSGIDVMTSGNHIWNKKEILPYLEHSECLIRPANYPPNTPGTGYCLVEKSPDLTIGVLNLMGRSFFELLECPFRKGLNLITRMRKRTPLIIIDFHGEATAEKCAFAWYVDGKVSAVVGTHTHVQTADERILPGGSAFITDVGMVGAGESVIGTKVEDSIQRFITNRPNRFNVAKGPAIFNACLIDIDRDTGKSIQISRLFYNP